MTLRPFWQYYGGKWRAAPKYPEPQHSTIVEPFAGSAGYSMRYPDRQVILVERFHKIAEIWRYLISAPAEWIRAVPLVEHVDDLPDWTPDGARWLVGFWLNAAAAAPRQQLSAGVRRLQDSGRKFAGWVENARERVASQVEHIRHWRVIEGDWHDAPDVEATWFVDPPYDNRAGSHYVHSDVDYQLLGRACRDVMRGQVIACENEGANWLPFRALSASKAAMGRTSQEAIWTNEDKPCPRPRT